LMKADEWITARLLRHPVPLLTSYAHVRLRKVA
jgi:hypothetical protein